MPTKPRYAVPALEKGLDILESLSASPTPLTLTALSKALGRANSEIFRMVNLLEARGYVCRDDSGAYKLSLRLFQIAHAQDTVGQLLDSARGPMRTLSYDSGESCHLSVLEGAEIVILARAEAPRPVRLVVEVGGRFSAIHTTSGRMLLAGYPIAARQRILEASADFKKLSKAGREVLLTSLETIASDGCATAKDESVAGTDDAAVSVGSPDTGVHAALAIAALSFRSKAPRRGELVTLLRKCASEIDHNASSQLHRLKRD